MVPTGLTDAYAKKGITASHDSMDLVAYICHPPAILSLMVLREVPYTLKNTSKPSKYLVITSLVLSTPLRVLVLGLALERVSKQGVEPCEMVLEVNQLVSRSTDLLEV